ncbi:hypothetical protein BFJ67_g17394 [Fusarium oxysporum f. sp. cepae]|nr:hypothetical protein BFJ67_g17394 [Fusarium oxysporum f. sp. cepae]
MFWAVFSYDKKGPCHCWGPETAKERKDANLMLEELNAELEPVMREQRELTTGVRRLGLRALPRKKPTWKWKKETGKLTRGEGKGIGWWRYQQTILLPKLLPFAKKCEKERPGTIVQEGKAPSHAHPAQQRIYDLAGVQRLLWCGNSPDLNAIEPDEKGDYEERGAEESGRSFSQLGGSLEGVAAREDPGVDRAYSRSYPQNH